MIYLLDANVLVHLANQVTGAERIQTRIDAQPHARVRLSAVTAHELLFMILSSKASPRKVASLATIVREFPVMDFDLPAASAAADVRLQMNNAGLQMGMFDMLLAGHARRVGAIVVTDDMAFARVPGLKTENWRR